ncbi:MAG TPA: hypothetical protein VLE27_10890 [Thermoanaerobaculia bacterium]|nr:hypothetical protein [Thermoanaerobaculia bacterium]
MSLSERIQQLNREISATVERALTDLRQEIGQRLRASNDEVQRRLDELVPALPDSFLSHEDLLSTAERELGPGTRRNALRDLRDGVAVIDRARSQADILNALLRESLRYASRAVVLLNRGTDLRGWGSQGFGDAEAALRELSLNASPDTAWGRLAQGEGAARLSSSECAELCSRIESPLPRNGVLVPVILRDRVAAGLYADRLDDGDLALEGLQLLAYAAAQAIETLPFRERPFTPTLVLLNGDEPAADPQPEPRAETAPPAAAVTAPEPHVEEVEELEVEAEPEPAPVGEPAPWTAGEERADEPSASASPATTQSWSMPSYQEPAATPAEPSYAPAPAAIEEAMEEEVPGYPRSLEPEPAAVGVQSASPEATVLLQRSALLAEPEPAPSPLRSVPPPAEPAAAFGGAPAGTPEVLPPSGVDGPGWAFATTRVPVAPNTESLHEEARRLARLLVSEIKLYNEEQVDEGRRNRDIYERLKEDIDRSRQMYDERVDPQVLRSTDYFYQELVRILAAGDSKALGI